MATYPRRTVTRTLQRTPEPGPTTGGLVPLNFCFGGNAGVVDATCEYKVDVPCACRIMAVTAGTGAAKANSPTFAVATTTGAVLAASAVPSDAGGMFDISGATSANRDVAEGEFIEVTYTDVSGSTTGTGFTVTVWLWIQGFPWTDASADDEAND